MKNYLLLSSLVFLFVSCQRTSEVEKADVTVTVKIHYEETPLELEDKVYVNFGNNFIIEKFQAYLSNMKLQVSGVTSYTEPDSYHLVTAERGVETYSFILKNVPVGTYSSLNFGLGVDEEANLSIDNTGDLDPTNQMAWNWNIGYKFVLLEGRHTDQDGNDIGLIYHIGFSENYLPHTLEFPNFLEVTSMGGEIEFTIEASELFKNPHEVNMLEMNTVKFDKEQVTIIVDNYKNGFIKMD